MDLKTAASPPPLPVVRGELKNVQSGGRSSEKGADSPAWSRKINERRRRRESKTVLFASDVALIRAIRRNNSSLANEEALVPPVWSAPASAGPASASVGEAPSAGQEQQKGRDKQAGSIGRLIPVSAGGGKKEYPAHNG